MLNVFLQYSIAIPFLILLLMRARSHSCVYNQTTMLNNQKYILVHNINNVKQLLAENFTTYCKTKKDTSLSLLDLCNNVTKVNETRKHIKADCYNISRNTTFCCPFKNLVYFGCLLNHHTKHLVPNTTSAIDELIKRLTDLVKYSNDTLCTKSSNKKHKKKVPTHDRSWRKEICKLNETLHRYATFWQEFRASSDCT
ncbi:uncharacterized protein LOC143782819 [Ranitomeya variabilis]|uniref:uncharacterized protein LOC143782819 n=1 Tax=Ranitomeya variabilis TaxID=490064 RepID=UPI0040572765